MYLLNKKRATAKEMSDHFEVSSRTIQRDIDALSMAGFPVFAWQGRNGGYELLDTFKMDRNFLTSHELETLRTVLSGIETTYTDDRIQRLTQKFEYMDHSKPESLEEVRKGIIQIDLSGWGGNEALQNKIQSIRKSIEDRFVIQFSYANIKGQFGRRSVEPVNLILKSNNWYLYGYCLSREDYRVFKLGRISDLHILQTRIERYHEPNPFDISDNSNTDTRPKTKLILKFKEDALGRISDYFGLESLKKDEAGHYLVEVTYPEDEWVYGMILSFGSSVEVIEPDHIREIISRKARLICDVYN